MMGPEEAGRSRMDAMLGSGDKQAKNDVSYRPAEEGTESCADCTNFLAEDQGGFCDLVAGGISPVYVCDLYAPAGTPPETLEEPLTEPR